MSRPTRSTWQQNEQMRETSISHRRYVTTSRRPVLPVTSVLFYAVCLVAVVASISAIW